MTKYKRLHHFCTREEKRLLSRLQSSALHGSYGHGIDVNLASKMLLHGTCDTGNQPSTVILTTSVVITFISVQRRAQAHAHRILVDHIEFGAPQGLSCAL